MLKIRKGDDVVVRSGKYKGQKGVVEKVLREAQMVVVTGVNIAKRHVSKRITGGSEGTIVEVAKPMRLSKIALVNSDGKPTRVRFDLKDGKKMRVTVKGGEVVKG